MAGAHALSAARRTGALTVKDSGAAAGVAVWLSMGAGAVWLFMFWGEGLKGKETNGDKPGQRDERGGGKGVF
jgi:hypothetical protein